MFFSLRNFHPLRVAASAGLKGALPKVLVGAALLGGGGSVLFAGSAQAISFNSWVGGAFLGIDDKVFTHSGTPDPVLVALNPDVNTTQPVAGDYLLNVDFASFVTTPFTLNYTATATGGNFFTAVDLDSDVDAFAPPGGCPVTGLPATPECEVLTATFTNFAPAVVLNSVNGNSSASLGAGAPTVLNVTNVFTPNGGAIDSFENSYRQGTKVPGPLPLLGAGMAFGFSRKLRSRIKARVQA